MRLRCFVAISLAACSAPPALTDGSVDVARADTPTTADRQEPPFEDVFFPETDGALATDATLDGSAPGDARADSATSALRYDQAVFRATHNSYSGGERSSVRAQLDRGVRFIELDVQDNDYAAQGYRVGHLVAGNEVDHTPPNPATDRVDDWLRVIASWSSANTTHAPITVALDLKDALDDNFSFAEGNPAALNELARNIFGARIFAAESLGAQWPTVDALRGRIVLVLSGDAGTRDSYLRDRGRAPSVTIDRAGRVLEAHESASGDLWYWSGQHDSTTGAIRWLRHGKYDSGVQPCIILRDDGVVLEVHKSPLRDRLFARVGRLSASGDVSFGPSVDYDDGVLPTVQWTSGNNVVEVHRSQARDQNFTHAGVVDALAQSVAWSASSATAMLRFDTASATANGVTVSVESDADTALRYSTQRATRQFIRYQQLFFTEYQDANSATLRSESPFWANSASSAAWLTDARRMGRIVRGWGFNSVGNATSPMISFAATDTPAAPWYEDLMLRSMAVR